MKSALAFTLASLASGALAGPAIAQPVTSPADVPAAPSEPAALGVDILDPDNALSSSDVRGAIGAELGVPVVDATAFAPKLGRLEIAIEQGVVRIAYHPAPGTVIERTLALPVAAADRLQLIAFVATNLVRDQASEVLGGLPALPPIPPPVQPAPIVVRQPPTKFMPFTLGLVPPLTIDRALGQRVSVGFGLHAIMGLTDETRYATVSGAVDVVSENMHGVQIGGAVAATFGHVRGLQLGGAVALARGSLFGAQVGGAAVLAGGSSTGIQVGGAASIANNLYGIQIGGAATAAKHVDGAQIGGAATVNASLHGLQIAGAANVSGKVRGVQIAGAANIAGDVDGVQIGAVNIARKMRGVQIGVVNLSDDGDDSYPIGIINYSKNGGIALDGWIDSSRVSAVGFRHGTKHIHNIWSIGWSPDHDNILVGAGLGVTTRFADDVHLDVDVMHWMTDVWDQELGQIDQLRASVGIKLGHGLEAFGGVAANVYIADVMNDDSDNFHPVMARTYTPTDSTNVVVWPSAFAGVRLKAR